MNRSTGCPATETVKELAGDGEGSILSSGAAHPHSPGS